MEEKKQIKFLCVDGSKHSDLAFEWFCKHVYHEGDRVGVIHVHVLPDLPSFGMYAGGYVVTDIYQETVQQSIDESKKTVKKYRDLFREKDITAEIFIESMADSVGHTICKIAEKEKGLLLVVGQRGLGLVRRTLFGSVSDYLIHHAKMPVMIVPTFEEDEK
ncbi:universal stress protein Slr1101-like [Hydractinia symbiolongicarpus]|uniref:universal stress protein Slr1101-like n=1 Tax=Hydractinia symbiolongicarpus TaxID=13093 RepID=UPI0025503EB0|nr:universal stress protein Slr1101-like [Hydractinia symbiolongicarpus]